MNLTRNVLRKYGAKLGAAAAMAIPLLASATTTDPFTQVMTDATDRVESYGAAIAVLAGVGVLFMIAVKYVKKIPRAS